MSEYGRETELHVTCKYGLDAKVNLEKLRQLIASTPAFPVYVGSVSIFRQEDHDVVKLDVESPWLTDLHNKITAAFPCPGDKWPEFKAHITIAYVKSGSCDHLVGSDPFSAEGSPGAEFVAYEVEYTGPGELDGDERVREMMPLNKTDYRPKEMKEAVDPKDFIAANAPELFTLSITDPTGRMWSHTGDEWSEDRAKHFTLAQAEEQMRRERADWYDRQDEYPVPQWTELRIEPVLYESVDPKDFIIRNSPIGYHVKITTPIEAVFGGRPKNRPYYFQAHGRMSHEPGEPLAMEVAEQAVAYIKDRYGVDVDKYVTIEPVYESPAAVRNAVSGAV